MSALSVLAAVLGAAQPAPDLHWSMTLGARVLATERAAACVDRVVLVPDAATYLDEISRWTPERRWPVLFEDRVYAPMFVRRFKPAQVVRRAPAAARPLLDAAAIERAAISAWGDATLPSLGAAFRARGHLPPGVVIASAADPAWTAALALAAARGQVLAWLDEPFRAPDQAMSAAQAAALLRAVHDRVAGAGYPWEGLGDAIDAITICRDVAGRVEVQAGEFRAVTDMLGRGPQAGPRRYAFAGWIFGNEARSAYMAMCALFLARERVWLYDTYPEPQVRAVFGIEEASALLASAGYTVRSFDIPDTTKQGWLDLLPGGFSTDVLIMNSGGETFNFHLADDRAYPRDVPILDDPVALHLAHSFSLRSPANPDSVGGSWLARGVYAYAGAVDEPMLSAFVPPRLFAARCASMVPFLIAARVWQEGPPWKISTIGDPLMVCPPRPAPRIAPEPDAGDLKEPAREAMRRAAAGDAAALAESMVLLALIGKDDIAVRLWQRVPGPPSVEAARAALPALFRFKLADPFLRAWSAAGTHDAREVDMLWHLMAPRLARADQDLLLALNDAVRPIQAEDDLRRMAPHLIPVLGADQARRLMQRHIDRTPDPARRARLQQLLSGP
jgi:hypothetical protein